MVLKKKRNTPLTRKTRVTAKQDRSVKPDNATRKGDKAAPYVVEWRWAWEDPAKPLQFAAVSATNVPRAISKLHKQLGDHHEYAKPDVIVRNVYLSGH